MLATCVARLIHMRTALKRMTKSSRSPAALSMEISDHAQVAIDFAHEVYFEWDRECAIVQGYGPTVMWDSLGRGDTSFTGCGGFLVDGASLRAFYHFWSEQELQRALVADTYSTTVLELMGAGAWANMFGPYVKSTRVQLEMDCAPAVIDILKAFSALPVVLECVTEFRLACARSNIHLRTRHVLGEVFNKIADALSRDNLAEACRVAKVEFDMELTLMAA